MEAINFVSGITAILGMSEVTVNFIEKNGPFLAFFVILMSAIYMNTEKNYVPFFCSIVVFFIACCLRIYLNVDTKTGLSESKPIEETTNLMTLFRQHAEEAEDEELLKIFEEKFKKYKIDDTKLLNTDIDTLLEKFKFDDETHKERFIFIRALIRKAKIEKRNKIETIALNPSEVKRLSWDQVAQLLHAKLNANEKQFVKWCIFLEENKITGQVLVNMKPESIEEYMQGLGLVKGQRVLFETMMKEINTKTKKSKSIEIIGATLGVAAFGDNSNVTTGQIITNNYDSKKEDKNSNENTTNDADSGSNEE